MRPTLPTDTTWIATLAILALMVGSTAAFAQPAPPSAIPDQTLPPRLDAPSNEPTRLTPRLTPRPQNPSETLALQDGVIAPPDNVDHGIVKPPPQSGTMPVIPPPGTPGSTAPDVQPK